MPSRTEREWLDVIPELAYDLIARIPPGLFLVCAVPLSFVDQRNTAFNYLNYICGTSNSLRVFVFVVSCYCAGMLITPLGGLLASVPKIWFFVYACTKHRHLTDFVRAQYPDLRDTNVEELRPLSEKDRFFRQMHALVKDSHEQGRGVVLKMAAESAMYANFLAGSLLLLLVAAISKVMSRWIEVPPVPPRQWWIWISIVALFSFGATIYSFRGFMLAQAAYLGEIYKARWKTAVVSTS